MTTQEFFQTYQEAPTGSFIGKDEKNEMVNDATSFPIKSVTRVNDSFNPGGFRYIIRTEVDGEERLIGFGAGSVTSRDSLLDAATTYLETEGAIPPVVKMEQQGRAVVLVEA